MFMYNNGESGCEKICIRK